MPITVRFIPALTMSILSDASGAASSQSDSDSEVDFDFFALPPSPSDLRRERQRRWREKRRASDPDGFASRQRAAQAKHAARHPDQIVQRNADSYIHKRSESLDSYRRRKRTESRTRYAEDPLAREAARQRALLRRHLCREETTEKTSDGSDVFGYPPAELRGHLEALFAPGMNWENWGSVWTIDHIRPVATYVKEGERDPAIISALRNLQPLWAQENRRKAAKPEGLAVAVPHSDSSEGFGANG